MNLNTMTDLEIKNLLIDLQAEVEKRVNSSPKKKTVQKEAEELSSLVAELDNSLELTFDLDSCYYETNSRWSRKFSTCILSISV